MERVEALRHCPVLSSFSDVGLKILAAVARERVYTPGQPLQAQGEPPRDAGVVFLVTGRVRAEVRDGSGQLLELGTFLAGDHLGALRLFGEAPSPVAIVAEAEVTALVIDRPAFARLQRHKPGAATKLAGVLMQDFGRLIGESSQALADFAVFAGIRANLAERGQFASYAALGLDLTPTLRGLGAPISVSRG